MNEAEFRIVEDRSYEPGAVVEKDGVHFGYFASGLNRPVLILYRRGSEEIAGEIPFPESRGAGRFYSMKVKLRASMYEYNFREGDRIVTDPYAKKICGREVFGQTPPPKDHGLRGGFVTKQFDWEGDRRPELSYSEAVMYHLHVRGFTKQKHSGVRKKGTFAGLVEKLPYLKELGVNQVKLMPAYDFPEILDMDGKRQVLGAPGGPAVSGKMTAGIPQVTNPADGAKGSFSNAAGAVKGGFSNPAPAVKDRFRMNFWGYGPGFYFAPKSSYAASGDPVSEFKTLVREAHRLGIEILMEFSFSDGTDIEEMIRCLTYWAEEYHVDGFQLMARESVASELARLPLFRTVKLIYNWFPDHLTRENLGENRRLLAESNDGFQEDCRKLLKGDEQMLGAFTYRTRRGPSRCGVINYITNHDGFTMADLVTYDRKYNLDNGEQDRDGSDRNFSWNCGLEGPTRKRDILRLRMRQRKNAYAMMLFSQGTPMLLAGDELGNSQDGNNNPYCHDSELTWVDWSRQKANQELTQFVKDAIAYRRAHKVLRQTRELTCTDMRADGFPDLSFHGDNAWYCDMDRGSRHIGCMYSGMYAGEKGFLYIAWNFHWMEREFALPLLPRGMGWYKVMDTSLEKSFPEEAQELGRVKSFLGASRTIIILEGREYEAGRSDEADQMEKNKRTL